MATHHAVQEQRKVKARLRDSQTDGVKTGRTSRLWHLLLLRHQIPRRQLAFVLSLSVSLSLSLPLSPSSTYLSGSTRLTVPFLRFSCYCFSRCQSRRVASRGRSFSVPCSPPFFCKGEEEEETERDVTGRTTGPGTGRGGETGGGAAGAGGTVAGGDGVASSPSARFVACGVRRVGGRALVGAEPVVQSSMGGGSKLGPFIDGAGRGWA